MKFGFKLIDHSDVITTDWEESIRQAIHDDTEDLRDTLLGFVLDRSPYLTGALQKDETGYFNDSNTSNPLLIRLYTETDDQKMQWHRVYAHYVEGPSLGEESSIIANSFVNSSRRPKVNGYYKMFARVLDEDMDYIERWFLAGVESGAERIVHGKGVR